MYLYLMNLKRILLKKYIIVKRAENLTFAKVDETKYIRT